MKVAIAQFDMGRGDIDFACQRIEKYTSLAHARGAELVIFPYASFAEQPLDAFDQELYLFDVARALLACAENLPCAVLIPLSMHMTSLPFDDFILINEGKVASVKGKYLNGLLNQDENIPFSDEPLSQFSVGGHNFAVASTYDELDMLLSEKSSADALIFTSSYPYAADDPSTLLASALSESRYTNDAHTSCLWFIGVGSLGVRANRSFAGGSFVMAPWGELLSWAPNFEEELVVCDIDFGSEGPLPRPMEPELYDHTLMQLEALSYALEHLTYGLGKAGLALTLDGSCASSVCAALACDALGPTHVVASLAPELSGELKAAATRLAENLHIELKDFESPRELRHFAREQNFFVLAPYTKTELALFPDELDEPFADLCPLGDVYTSDVLDLARFRNTISPIIPHVLTQRFRQPKAAILPHAKELDESKLSLVDNVLSTRIEWAYRLNDIVRSGFSEELCKLVLSRLEDGALRRASMPPVLAMSCCLLADIKRPVGFGWHDHIRPDGEPSWETVVELLGKDSAAASFLSSIDIEKEIKEMLGYLRDFSYGGALTQENNFNEGGHGFLGMGGAWDTPFSEN